MTDNNTNKKKNFIPNTPGKPNYQIWIILSIIVLVFSVFYFNQGVGAKDTTERKLWEMMAQGHVKEVLVIQKQNIVEITLNKQGIESREYGISESNSPFAQGPHFILQIESADKFIERFNQEESKLPEEKKIGYKVDSRSDPWSFLLNWGFLFFILFIFWFLMRRMTGAGGPGGQIFNIGKSKASLFDAESKVKTSFNDVAGLEEAKEEVKEIVDFLKTPDKYTKLGGKIPKGALLIGPPGTGKTLLAKAVAGEAAVPFFSISGSDFVEMFVGVGAARVRDLFKQAKEKAPCIVFIDEIDAIGRSRGKGSMPGSNDERENTLNSLLVEMDGFATDSGVIILAASNRPDVLDPALLRAGRFDRQISIDKPDIIGREAIFKVHIKPLKLAKSVDPKKLATQTPGFAGAEIANVCNEAALIAARQNKSAIEDVDFHDAIDRVIGGLEKKNKIISPEEKNIIAHHEAGHAVAGWFLEHADPLVKVSIVPRGTAALGYAQYLPKEQFIYQTEQLLDEMCMALGGRAAEEITFGKVSTGALNDLERVTKMAYSMVTIYGMSDKIGTISFFDSKQGEYNFTKPYSEETARVIDAEAKDIVDKAYQRTIKMLKEKRQELEVIAAELLKKEIIFQTDLEKLIGKRPFEKQTTYEAFTSGTMEKERNDHKKEQGAKDKKAANAYKRKNAKAKEVESETPKQVKKNDIAAKPSRKVISSKDKTSDKS